MPSSPLPSTIGDRWARTATPTQSSASWRSWSGEMDIRAHIASVFHLDKCIGCHTCSIACKNIWTDRKGTEYMWWNNVETKPGTGYPTLWEDQEKYRGGWEWRGERLRLRLQGRLDG